MKTVPELKTDRLLLRGIREEDTTFIVKLRTNPDVYTFFLDPHKLTETEHKAWYRNQYLRDDNRLDWIAHLYTGEPIGIFGLKRYSKDSDEVEISYIVDSAYQRQGFAKEAVTELTRFTKKIWHARILIAKVHYKNEHSKQFAHVMGMTQDSFEGKYIVFKRIL